MPSYKEKIEILKRLVGSNEEIDIIFKFFLDKLSEDDGLHKASKKAKHPYLKQLIKNTAENRWKTEVKIEHLLILKPPKSTFHHGTCFINKHMAAFFFFSDTTSGMICMYANGMVHYSRFTGTIIKGNQAMKAFGAQGSEH